MRSTVCTTFVVALLATASAPVGARGPTRDEMMETAAAFAEHVWTCSEDNAVGGLACSADWTCDWEAGQEVQGLPYDWGGYKTIEMFDQDIADGLGAGSHSWHGILNCTTGLDCSGFVSRVWECGRYATSTFYRASHGIDPEDLLPGDAYNKAGSHIVLWVRESDSGQPVFYEATAGSVNRVHLNENATWSTLEGYVPIRSDLLELPDYLRGTPDDPIDISDFPFEDVNDTTFSPSDSWDSYGCAPQREEGPEVVYRFRVANEGALRIEVTDDTGVDIDIHLLASADPDDCLVRNDTEIVYEALPPGTYHIAADSWTSDAGTEFPGPYALRVEFTSDVEPEPDVVGGEDVVEPDVVTASDGGGQNVTGDGGSVSYEVANNEEDWSSAPGEVEDGLDAGLGGVTRTKVGGDGCSAANGERSTPGALVPIFLVSFLCLTLRGRWRRAGRNFGIGESP